MDNLSKWIFIGIILITGVFAAGPCLEYIFTRTEAIGTPSEDLTKSELEKTKDGYTIQYDLDGGTTQKENKTTYGVFTSDFVLNNPSKDGFQFIGWTGSNGTEPKISIKICKGSSGDLNFTANYMPIYEKTQFYYNNSTGYLTWTCDPHFTTFNIKVNGNVVKTVIDIYELPILQLSNYFANGTNIISLDSVAEDVTYSSPEVQYTYYSSDYSINMEFHMSVDKTDTSYILTASDGLFVEYAFDGTFINASNYAGKGGYPSEQFFRALCQYEPTYYIMPRTISLFDFVMIFVKQANNSKYTFDLTNDFYILPKALTGDIGNLPKFQAIFNLSYSFIYEEIEIPTPNPDPEPDPEPDFEFDATSTSLDLDDISKYNHIDAEFNTNGGSLTLSLLTTEGHVLYIKYTTSLGNNIIQGWTYNPFTETVTNVDDIKTYSRSLTFRIINRFTYSISKSFWNGTSWHDYPTAMEYLFNTIYTQRQLKAQQLGVDVLSDFEYSAYVDCGMEGHLFIIDGMEGNYGISCKFTSSAN